MDMNKTELITAVAKSTDVTKVQVEKILNSFFTIVGETLSAGKEEGEKVQIMGFGTFRASFVEGRIGVNPRNRDEEIEIPDGYRVHFSAGQQLKDIVNEKTKVKKSSKAKAKAKAKVKGKAKKVEVVVPAKKSSKSAPAKKGKK
jgi:DNA-binding protein HU-beta